MKQEIVEKYFDKWANDFILLPDETSFHIVEIANKIKERLFMREEMTILDLGIGNGRIECALNLVKNNFIGIDISSEQLASAEKRMKKAGIHIKLIKHNIETDIPLNDNSVDVVISNATFHHIKNKKRLFSEIFRILKREGKLIFFDFYFGVLSQNYLNIISSNSKKFPAIAEKFRESIRKEHSLMPKYLEETHPVEYHVNPNDLIKTIKEAGFKECEKISTFYEKYFGIEVKK